MATAPTLGKLSADENALWSLGAHDVSVLLRLAGEGPYEVEARGRELHARSDRGHRVLLPAVPVRAWRRTCTCRGWTRTRSAGSRSSARRGWRPSTTWRSRARSPSTTRASTSRRTRRASTSRARAISGASHQASYHVLTHLQPAMRDYAPDRELPGTTEAARTDLAIPMSPVLTREQADGVTAAARRC